MTTIPNDRQVQLGCVILRLFPKVMQIILKEYINLRGLRGKFKLKDLRTNLTEDEISLMEQLPNTDKFTIELCYKMLRYENVMPEPSSKWGNTPHDTEVDIADDIQRIINASNEIISKKCEDISEEYFKEFINKIEHIIKRVDENLQLDTCCKIYRSIWNSDTSPAEILQEMTLLKKLKVSQNVDKDGENRELYSRVSLVITDTFPNILRYVIRSLIPASRLYQLCLPHLKSFSPDQEKNLQDLDLLNSYESLDITLVYRLIRQFQLLPSPTNGWGTYPDKKDKKICDDVERIRYYRNQLAHRSNTNIEKQEFEDYFDNFCDIGHRIDLNFFQKTNYEETIILQKTCRMDKQMQIKYENALKELENIKLRFESTPIKFYWGDSFDRSLSHLRYIMQDEKSKGREKVRVQIIFQSESDVEKTIDILNSLMDEINAGLSGIEFIVARKGSIVLNVDITLDMFETDSRLQSIIVFFLERILECIATNTNKSIDTVLIIEEEYHPWNKKSTGTEPVCLDFDVTANLFQTDDKLKEHLEQISIAISKHLSGSEPSPNITATLLPISFENTSIKEELFVQAQSPVKNNLPYSVRLHQELDIQLWEQKDIFDCIIINKMLAFTGSFDMGVTICNANGTYHSFIPLPYRCYYITEVDKNTVAVSCSYNNIILMIDIYRETFRDLIKTSNYCYGMSYQDSKLYIAIESKGIQVFNFNGDVLHTIVLPSVYINDITVNSNSVVGINERSVFCASLDGKLLWTFENVKYISFRHVTADNYGNVYITDYDTNAVVVISRNCSHFREIITKAEGMNSPIGLHFDKNENILMVCNENDRKAYLFRNSKEET